MKFFKFAALLIFVSCACAKADVVIKFATLAPDGTEWMNKMRGFSRDVLEKSSGAVKFKIYAGGVMGDEKDVVRKIKAGQLHAGGFTGVGIGEIAPSLRVLDAPFLFKSPEEADYIYKEYDAKFRKELSDKGYVLLGWTEVGFVYLFTNVSVGRAEDLGRVKMWLWEGDPIASAAFKAMKMSPRPLSIADVTTSLQTGLVDGVYGSPMSVIALQWFSKVKYMFSLPIANAEGAALVSKKMFDQIAPENQKIILALGEKWFAELTKESRSLNQQSIETLKKEKIIITQPSGKEAVEQFNAYGAQARKSLVGKLYSAELLADIEKSLENFRNPKKEPAPVLPKRKIKE